MGARRRAAEAARVSSVPFDSSSPLESTATRGRGTPSTRREKTSPMSPNCTRWSGLHSTLAPPSSMIDWPFSVGSTVMIAGRSTAPVRPRTKIAPAITAPLLPAETMPQASPRRTISKQSRMELSFLRRIAWPGWSSISTTSVAFRTAMGRLWPARWRTSSSRTRASRPTRTTASPLRAALIAPWTMAPGAWSPPIASTATGAGRRMGRGYSPAATWRPL